MPKRWILAAGLAACSVALWARTLEFETTEVSQPALAVAPDGRSFVFNLLGHLYRLSAAGGSATQLTFGPYYDSEPVFSPDGSRIAFVSNRDGSDGNIFVMDASGAKIAQLTHEFQTGTPAWSPDVKTIAFVSLRKREEYPVDRIPGFGGTDTGALMTVSAQGGATQRLSEPRTYVSVFYLPDGRLAWTVAERGAQPASLLAAAPVRATTFEARTPQGATVRLGSLPGAVNRAVLNTKGDGFFYIGGGNLRHYTFGATESKVVAPWPGGGARFALSRDNQTLYAGAEGKLWRLAIGGGGRQQIVWSAKAKMEPAEPIAKKWTPPASSASAPRAVLTPRLSPDGKQMVFMAGGAIYEQTLDGGQARKLIDEAAFQCEPAFSPDGKLLAFVSDNRGRRELRVLDFSTRQTRTLAGVKGASWILFPYWSGDGKTLVYQRSDQIGAPFKLVRVDLDSGASAEVAQSVGSWVARPHFSSDGGTLYFTSRPGKIAAFYRLALRPGAQPEALTDLTRHIHDGLVSPDGKWLAYRRNSEIWLGRMESRTLKDSDFQRFSDVGGRSFSFTLDSSALVYSEGAKVWRRSLQGGAATEIPVRLTLPRPAPAPLLISRVRVLDFKSGRFGNEESMLIEQGRIRWTGPEAARTIPADVVRMDGQGRFAIPGLWDSHTHTAWSNQQISEDSLIAYGVTSVRDTGSRIDLITALEDRGDSTNLPVPRYFYSGDIFEGFMPLWGDAFLEITTPEEARTYVRHWKDLGAQFVKLYASLPWYVKTPAAEEARRLGMPMVGHGLSTEEIVRSVNLGFASVEHNFASTEDIMKLLAASGTKLDPTLTIGAGTRTMLAGDPPLAIDAKFRKYVPEDAIDAARPGGTVGEPQRNAFRGTLAQILRGERLGVKLLDGTDALMTGVFFGPSMHWELQFFSEADIPSLDVLRIATLGAAEAVGASADVGSLEPGKLGDVVLLDGNPLEDIRNTMKIWRVVKGGRPFDPAAMR